MTIHDIILNCGSMLADTLIIITDGYGEVKWQNTFKNLTKDYEELEFKFFTVGFMFYNHVPRVFFKFLCIGGDYHALRYPYPSHSYRHRN